MGWGFKFSSLRYPRRNIRLIRSLPTPDLKACPVVANYNSSLSFFFLLLITLFNLDFRFLSPCCSQLCDVALHVITHAHPTYLERLFFMSFPHFVVCCCSSCVVTHVQPALLSASIFHFHLTLSLRAVALHLVRHVHPAC